MEQKSVEYITRVIFRTIGVLLALIGVVLASYHTAETISMHSMQKHTMRLDARDNYGHAGQSYIDRMNREIAAIGVLDLPQTQMFAQKAIADTVIIMWGIIFAALARYIARLTAKV